jgi:hypothetical protein
VTPPPAGTPWTPGVVGTVGQITSVLAGLSLSVGDYYFTITQPNSTLLANNEYRLVVVNQTGNVADTSVNATSVSDGGSVSGW